MKKTLLSFLVLACMAANAQRTNHKGRIVDKFTGRPIPGAQVQYQQRTSISAPDGSYIVKIFQPTDSIEVYAIGYSKQILPVHTDTVFLHPAPFQLREMVLVSRPALLTQQVQQLDQRVRGLNNAQELLRMVPGLFIGQHAGGGKAEQIFLRGFDVDHGTDVSITTDGMPVNMVSHAHGQGYADLHFIIPEVVDQVQFGKGPYEASKGNFTTAGHVSLQSKESLENNLLKLEVGQFNTLRGLALLQLIKDKGKTRKGLYLAAEHLRSQGFFEAPQDFGRTNLFARYQQDVGRKSQLDISASYFQSEWNASGQIPERAVKDGSISFFGAIDPNEGGNTSRSNLNLRMRSQVGANSLLNNQFFVSAYDFELFSNFTFWLNDPVNGDQIRQAEKRVLWGYNGSWQQKGRIGSLTHQLEAGWGLRADATRNSSLAHTLNRTSVLHQTQLGNVREWNSAAYLQEILHLPYRMALNGGLRFDHFVHGYYNKLDASRRSKTTAIVSPRVHLSWQARKNATLYFGAGRGFHSNDARVVVQTAGREALPAAWSMDLGVQAKPAASLLLQAALWQLALEQEFIYVGDEGIVEPSGRSIRRGIEFSGRYQPFAALYIDADFNYTLARSADAPKGEDYLPLAPRFTATGGISYKKEKGLNGNLRYRWMGARPANEDNSIQAASYFVADALLAYTWPRVEVQLSAQNIFDTRWKETQFATTSRLKNETEPVTEIHFTPGTPFFLKAGVSLRF